MCGICGIFNYRDGGLVDSALLMKMASSIYHRGPDDEGYYLKGELGIAMRRLSIIDLEGGHQPITNENGTIWIVFNGEIYNFNYLRNELEKLGHQFRTRSDTETIIHSYEEWGMSALNKLNGMFSIAIWDERNHQLILARDPFGIKPLYFYEDGKRILFGSELKAILQDLSIPREVDLSALNNYLTFRFTPSPRTMMKGISKIPPGHYLVCNENGYHMKRFHFCKINQFVRATEDELVENLRYLLKSAVRRQMISDVPVGALLSGGTDSNSVVQLMQEFSSDPIFTFTVGFTEQGDFNELESARITAKRLGTNHHEIVISAKDYINFWPTAMWYLEEPIVTPSVLPMYYVSKLASEYVKVVLTGQGADEPWAGYKRYEGEQLSSYYQHIPAFFRNNIILPIVEALPRLDSLKRAARSLGEKDPARRFSKIYAVFEEEQKCRLFNNAYKPNEFNESDAVRFWQQDVSSLNGLSQMMYVDSRFSLPDDLLLYGDKMSMANSLEARVPMLDLELMEFVENLPSNMRLRGNIHKYLYRKAISKWVPDDVLHRRKRGFDTPMDKWLGNDFLEYSKDLLLSSQSGCGIYFDKNYLSKMIDEHSNGRFDYRRHIYCLLSFEIWYQLFIQSSKLWKR